MQMNKMDSACSTYGEGKGAYRILIGKPDVERPLRRSRHRWEDKIKMNAQEVVWGR
jgi:hypothetical protein